VDELACFSEVSRERAFERFQLLRAHLEDGITLAAIAREAKLSYRTLQYWLERYRTYGLVGLVHKPRTDRGRRRKLSAALQELIEGLALQKPPLPIRVVCNRVCNRARLAAERFGEEPPSYDLVHDVVSRLPTDLVTLAHQGAKAYSNSFELVYRREASRPNAIWQADHTSLDIELVQSELDPTRTAKPWLTLVIDDYSRAVAGYFVSFESPSSINTALALRQAIWRKEDPRWKVCGIPEVLYTDNGSDFTCRHLEQVSADLKIRLVFSTPGVPRGREPWADTTTHAGKMIMTIFSGIAEFERGLIRERTSAEREAAKKRGVRFGRPPKLNADQKLLARRLVSEGKPAREIATVFNVHAATIYRLAYSTTGMAN
jgi:putative transposase